MPEDLDFDPEDREAALERGFTQHDTLTFRGKRLRPLTLSSWRLLCRSGNGLVFGVKTDVIGDAAAFVLLHAFDEDEHAATRAQLWRGTAAWNEYIHKYLDSNPDLLADLNDAAPMLSQMVTDFHKAQTKSISAGEGKKKSGAPDI
jgi:hypothetical protein